MEEAYFGEVVREYRTPKSAVKGHWKIVNKILKGKEV